MMTEVILTIDEEIFSGLRLSPKEFARDLRLAAAIYWYQKGEISQEKAAQLAGFDRADFISALVREGAEAFIVDFEDLKQELARG